MSIRRSNFACVATLVALAVVSGCALFSFREISLSYLELNERLSTRFPVERNMAGFLNITFMRPRVAPVLAPGAQPRLAVTLDLDLKLPSMRNNTQRSLLGSLTLSGIPTYDATNKSIHVVDARLDRVRVDHMPDALSDALAKTATQLAKEYLEGKPLYTLSPDQRDRLRLRPNGGGLRFEILSDRLLLAHS